MVERRDNPYRPGSGRTPPLLAGRREELATFNNLISTVGRGEHARSVLVMGLRGVGKTVLLNRIREEALSRSCLTAKLELHRGGAITTALARELVNLLGELKPGWRMRRSLTGALTGFAVFTFRDSATGIEVDVAMRDFQTAALSSDFSRLTSIVGKAALDNGRGIILLVDEMQYAPSDELGAFFTGLHEAAQDELPVALVGAGIPQVSATVAATRTYAERMFSVTHLDSLPPSEARRALTVPAQRHDVVFDEIAVEQLLGYTGGYPYFIQEYGAHTWDATPGRRITPEVVSVAAPLAEAAMDKGFFQIRADRTDNAGKRVLRTLAELGDGPHPIAAIERRVRSRRTRRVVEGLIDVELLFEPDEGIVQFTVLGFAEFLLRRYKAL